jgi:hypothetical protein
VIAPAGPCTAIVRSAEEGANGGEPDVADQRRVEIREPRRRRPCLARAQTAARRPSGRSRRPAVARSWRRARPADA